MDTAQRLRYLRIALIGIGLICFAVYPLMVVWPSGWAWQTGISDYAIMIAGLYATLGVFLIRAARDPLANLSLIWFMVWSSIVHGGIMAIQSLVEPGQMGHLTGDVPVLLIAAIVLSLLTPRAAMHTAEVATKWDAPARRLYIVSPFLVQPPRWAIVAPLSPIRHRRYGAGAAGGRYR